MRQKKTKFMNVAVCALLVIVIFGKAESNASRALDAFFSELDNNHDGAIDVHEASQFIGDSIGGLEFDDPQEATDAANSFLHNIDGGDAGLTVSVDELDVHLHSVLNGVRVWDWIRHGVGLPQYAEAFRAHSITPLDFPVLVHDNGKVLEEELGVASPFHRAKLMRAIHYQILGLGQPPSEPQAVTCTSTGYPVLPTPTAAAGDPYARSGSASIQWSPPAHPGFPPLHRYVLERAGSDGQWRQVAELDDPEPAAVVVAPEAPSTMGPEQTLPAYGGLLPRGGPLPGGATRRSVLYRVAGWNLYGRSAYGVAACQLDSPVVSVLVATDPTDGTVTEEAATLVRASAAAEQQGLGPRGDSERGRYWGLSRATPLETNPLGREPGGNLCADNETEGMVATAGKEKATAQKHHQPQLPADGPARTLGPQDVPHETRGRLVDNADCSGLIGAAGDAAPPPPPPPPPAPGQQTRLQRRSHGDVRQARDQGQQGPPVHPTPQPRRWWSTLLVALVPWLLRLLPLRLLRVVVERLHRFALWVVAAVRWRLAAAFPSSSSVPAQPPRPQLVAHSARGVYPRIDSAPGAHGAGGLGAREDIGMDTAGMSGGGHGHRSSSPGAVEMGSDGAAASAAAPSGTAAPTTAAIEAPGMGMNLRTRSNWLELVFSAAAAATAATATPPPQSTEPALVPATVQPSHRRCLSQLQTQALATSSYGSDIKFQGNGVVGGAAGSDGCDKSCISAHLAEMATPRSRQMPYRFGQPHRSTSDGDICGLEDAEQSPSIGQSNYVYRLPGVAQLHSHLNPYQLAGSAPSLGQGLLSAAIGRQTGPHQPATRLGGACRGALREAETEGDLLAVAAAATGGVSGRGRGKMCAISGCGRKLDLRHYRDYMRRHYCGRCQRTVCGQHTAYSPHGPTGSCDHVSRCVCTSCFTHFNPAYQLFLLKHSKLQPTSGIGPQSPVASMTTAGLNPVQGLLELRGGRGGNRTGSRRGSASGNGGSDGSSGDNKSAAKLLWERAATKLKAVTRFRKKGEEGHDRESKVLEGIVE